MPRWFFAFFAVVVVMAMVLMFSFVKTGATQHTKSAPEPAAATTR